MEESVGLLQKVLQYELNAAERYRRFVSVVMVASSDGIGRLKKILQGTVRSSDLLAVDEETAIVLMSETDSSGALSAIERYKDRARQHDVRFSLVTYPNDGGGAEGLFATAQRRLDGALAGEFGAVVAAG